MCLASDKSHHDLSAAEVYLIFPPMLLNWSLQEKSAHHRVILGWEVLGVKGQYKAMLEILIDVYIWSFCSESIKGDVD